MGTSSCWIVAAPTPPAISTGGLLALHHQPGRVRQAARTPALAERAVSDIIRWQSQVAYMRRNGGWWNVESGANHPQGEKIAMWYVSGNRDERVIERANAVPPASTARGQRHHDAAFGFGNPSLPRRKFGPRDVRRVVCEEFLRR